MSMTTQWTEQVMERLYARLEAIYLQRWTAAFGDDSKTDEWRLEWANALERENISLLQAKAALDVCGTKYKSPPSLPQFISLCRFGGKTEEQLHAIAVKQMELRRAFKPQDWPSRGLFWAAASLGNDLLSLPYQQIKARWSEAIELFCNRPVDPIPEYSKAKALPNKPTPPERARENITRLKDMVRAAC